MAVKIVNLFIYDERKVALSEKQHPMKMFPQSVICCKSATQSSMINYLPNYSF